MSPYVTEFEISCYIATDNSIYSLNYIDHCFIDMRSFKPCKYHCIADDRFVYLESNNIKYVINTVNDGLNVRNERFVSNKLKLNVDKI